MFLWLQRAQILPSDLAICSCHPVLHHGSHEDHEGDEGNEDHEGDESHERQEAGVCVSDAEEAIIAAAEEAISVSDPVSDAALRVHIS